VYIVREKIQNPSTNLSSDPTLCTNEVCCFRLDSLLRLVDLHRRNELLYTDVTTRLVRAHRKIKVLVKFLENKVPTDGPISFEDLQDLADELTVSSFEIISGPVERLQENTLLAQDAPQERQNRDPDTPGGRQDIDGCKPNQPTPSQPRCETQRQETPLQGVPQQTPREHASQPSLPGTRSGIPTRGRDQRPTRRLR